MIANPIKTDKTAKPDKLNTEMIIYSIEITLAVAFSLESQLKAHSLIMFTLHAIPT